MLHGRKIDEKFMHGFLLAMLRAKRNISFRLFVLVFYAIINILKLFVSLYRRWNHFLSILESYLKHNKRLETIFMKFLRPQILLNQ